YLPSFHAISQERTSRKVVHYLCTLKFHNRSPRLSIPTRIVSTILKLNPHCLNPPSEHLFCSIFNYIIYRILLYVKGFLKKVIKKRTPLSRGMSVWRVGNKNKASGSPRAVIFVNSFSIHMRLGQYVDDDRGKTSYDGSDALD